MQEKIMDFEHPTKGGNLRQNIENLGKFLPSCIP